MKYSLLILLLSCFSTVVLAYDDKDLVSDMHRCGSLVHKDTLIALIITESKKNPYAIADAGPVNLPWKIRKKMVRSYYPDNLEDALKIVTGLLAEGHTVSIGLTQINDRNLPAFGVTLKEIFDPCTNIKYGSELLAQYYAEAVRVFRDPKKALEAALSKFNSGDFYRGRDDGYVDLIYKSAGIKLAKSVSIKKYFHKKPILATREFTLGLVHYE